MVNQQFAFAVHALSLLAAHPEKSVTSEAIAKSVNTNPVVIRRLLSKLSKNALVETQLGKKGGVRLKKKPEDITLKSIYLALQNRSLIAENENATNKKCAISCHMKEVMKTVIQKTEMATLDYLETIRLSDLTDEIPKL